MLRIWLLCLLGLMVLLPTANAQQIVLNPSSAERIAIEDQALLQAGDLFVPVEVVREYLARNVVVDQVDNRIQFTAAESSVGHGETLNFLTKTIGNREYLNLRQLDRLLEIDWKYTPQSGDLLIEKKQTKGLKSSSHTRPQWKPHDKIALAWDYIGKYSPDLTTRERIAGLDVLSPTWFRLDAANGNVVNHVDARYIAAAHAKGYQVWPLITNRFDSELTHQFFQDKAAQEVAIRQLAVYAALYEFDGLNIDFENMENTDSAAFVTFIEQLTEVLHRQNLIVSVDVTVPSNSPNWSLCYDRKKLGSAVDYVMVMTYDEHWSRSPVSGSVASLPWVKAGVEKMLTEVPAQKLLLGLPFYTREWRETLDDKGKIEVRSKVLSMAAADAQLREYGQRLDWLNEAGQYYFEYYKEGSTYKVWMEEERSIRLKAQLVKKYGLAGAACWRQGFENLDIWPALQEELKSPVNSSLLKIVR